MKKFFVFCGICFGVLVLYVIIQIIFGDYFEISSELEVNIPITAKMEYKDNYGGFLYDGETIAKIALNENQANKILNKIKENENWKEYPIDEFIENHLTLYEIEGITIPKVKNGYWFIKDRHRQAIDEYRYDKIYYRNSRNFSVGIYDGDSNILYYFREDT